MSTRNIFDLIFAGSLLLLPKPYAVSASGMWFSSLLYKFDPCNLLFCTFGTFGIIMAAGVVFFHGKHIFKTDLKTDVSDCISQTDPKVQTLQRAAKVHVQRAKGVLQKYCSGPGSWHCLKIEKN